MNLSQVIHAQWAADSTLNGLLPAAGFMTGMNFSDDPTFPYATLTRPAGTVDSRTNDGTRIDILPVIITLYHGADSYDEGVAIEQAIDDAFDDAEFSLANGDKVIQMRITGPPAEIQDEEGNWSWECNFDLVVEMGA